MSLPCVESHAYSVRTKNTPLENMYIIRTAPMLMSGIWRPTWNTTDHFGDESFRIINCTGTDSQTHETNLQRTDPS